MDKNDYEKNFNDLSRQNYYSDNKSLWNSLSTLYTNQHIDPPVIEFVEEIEKQTIKTMKIFEYGCSSGMNLNYLKNKGFLNLSGVDISETAINFGKQKFDLNIWVDDYTKEKIIEHKYDFVFCRAVLQHIEYTDVLNVLRNFYKILNNDGILLFSECYQTSWTFGRVSGHRVYNTFNHNWIDALKETGFLVVENKNENFSIFKCKKIINESNI